MEFSIWCRHAKTAEAIRTFANSKTNNAFARYEHQLQGGELRIERELDSGEPRSHCSLDLKSFAHGTIHVEETDANAYVAVSKAIRAGQEKLKRLAQRRKHNGRKRGRMAKLLSREEELSGEEFVT